MGGGGGYAARLFLLFSFPCSADHERDWPPCKAVFRVGNQYAECEKQQQQHQSRSAAAIFVRADYGNLLLSALVEHRPDDASGRRERGWMG